MFKRILVVGLLVAAVALVASRDPRRFLIIRLYSAVTGVAPLEAAVDEGSEVRWFDDYYTVHEVDPQTFAIGEPRYHEQNYNYLIVGDERAILFDSGPGVRDIVPVVRDLTVLSVTPVPSHLHYDHIGNHSGFGEIALVDLPFLRERVGAGVLRPTSSEHLGFVAGFERPYLHVGEWLAIGSEIDLGGRRLEVLHTPGHTRDSISLFDRERDQIFVGDFITKGPSFAFLPSSRLGDYLRSAEHVLAEMGEKTRVLGAHRLTAPGFPELTRDDIVELRDTLLAMKSGALESTTFFPATYSLDGGRPVMADLPWGMSWD
jgi:glyoxylase-like metal-dependent hydrolase (beta-lactamase superfamily II)